MAAASGRVLLLSLTISCGATAVGIGCGGGDTADNLEQGRNVYADHTTYVSQPNEISGDVGVGEHDYVAPNVVFDAAPTHRIRIGDETNAQDNVFLRALASDTAIADRATVAHNVRVRDSVIGDFTFVGFNTEVTDSKLGDGAFVLHGARVVDVEIPDDAVVPAGATVDRQDEADDLEKVEEADEEFKDEVLEVNEEFAGGYIELAEEASGEELTGVGPNPHTSWNAESVEPRLGPRTKRGRFVRVIGDARIGRGSKLGEHTVVRADEGAPIVLGSGAKTAQRVSFHALEGTSIRIGKRFSAGDRAVVHGPLEVGERVRLGTGTVLFRATVGDRVNIGDGAIVVGPPEEEGELRIPSGTFVPVGAVVTSQDDLDELTKR